MVDQTLAPGQSLPFEIFLTQLELALGRRVGRDDFQRSLPASILLRYSKILWLANRRRNFYSSASAETILSPDVSSDFSKQCIDCGPNQTKFQLTGCTKQRFFPFPLSVRVKPRHPSLSTFWSEFSFLSRFSFDRESLTQQERSFHYTNQETSQGLALNRRQFLQDHNPPPWSRPRAVRDRFPAGEQHTDVPV